MIGFEINYNGKNKKAAIPNGVITIVVSSLKLVDREEFKLTFSGTDLGKKEDLHWFSEDLQLGDFIHIAVKDIMENSVPKDIKKHDQEAIILQAKLKSFYGLKKELEEAGLL